MCSRNSSTNCSIHFTVQGEFRQLIRHSQRNMIFSPCSDPENDEINGRINQEMKRECTSLALKKYIKINFRNASNLIRFVAFRSNHVKPNRRRRSLEKNIYNLGFKQDEKTPCFSQCFCDQLKDQLTDRAQMDGIYSECLFVKITNVLGEPNKP